MTKKRQWIKIISMSIFLLFIGFSTILTFAIEQGTVRKPDENKAGGSRIGLGFLAGYGLFSDSLYSGSMSFGAAFTFGFSRNLAVELGGIYLKGNVDSAPESLSKGKLTTMPLQLSLMGRFPVGRKLTPYVLAGGSYFLNSFTLDRTVIDGWNTVGFTLTEKVDKSFGFHFGGGLEFALGKTLSACIDVRYLLAKSKGSWILKDNKSPLESIGTFSNLKLNSLMLAIGLKYFLK